MQHIYPCVVFIPKSSNMTDSLKGFAWNCGGLRRHNASTLPKIMYFEKTFRNDFDFFFFLETHHKDDHDIPNELQRYEDTHHIVHSHKDEGDTHTGIIGLVRNVSIFNFHFFVTVDPNWGMTFTLQRVNNNISK